MCTWKYGLYQVYMIWMGSYHTHENTRTSLSTLTYSQKYLVTHTHVWKHTDVHRLAPSKVPALRLEQLTQAGHLGIPFTTGILLGNTTLPLTFIHYSHSHPYYHDNIILSLILIPLLLISSNIFFLLLLSFFRYRRDFWRSCTYYRRYCVRCKAIWKYSRSHHTTLQPRS